MKTIIVYELKYTNITTIQIHMFRNVSFNAYFSLYIYIESFTAGAEIKKRKNGSQGLELEVLGLIQKMMVICLIFLSFSL